MPEIKPPIMIRRLEGAADLRLVQTLEKEVWNLADIDVLPLTWAVASLEAGAIWLGAFDDDKLIGFAFAFPSISHGALTFHSHQLAVQARSRDSELGFKLKLAQREAVLAVQIKDEDKDGLEERLPERRVASSIGSRISEISWTFDPLQSKNAHLNFSKLAVISNSYKVDLYGPETSSALHRNGTDRLWVQWPITSRRVTGRIHETKGAEKRAAVRTETLDALSTVQPLILFSGDGRPVRADLETALRRQRIAIEIPSDINSIERKDPQLAREWRMATRWAFTESLQAGFHVAEFCRTVRGQQGPGAYLLEAAPPADWA
ncbi:MAG: hypothetical protein ACRD2U_08870 [Terriglobales bacterium]